MRTNRLLGAALLLGLGISGAARAEWTDDAQRCYRAGGDTALTIQYCTRAIDSGKLTANELSTTFSNRGGQYEARGESELALADYNAAVRANPENPAGYIRRGTYYQRHGEHTKARAEFDKAIAIPVRPDNAVGYLQRARAHRAKGDLTAALADLEQGVRIDATVRELHLEQANIYSSRSDYRRVIDAYNAALKLNSGDAFSLSSRGGAYLNLGDFQRALADYDAAIALEPKVAARYATRANTQRALGNLDGALADYSRAVELEPKRGLRYTARAAIHQVRGDRQSAMADFDRAIQAEPDRSTYLSSRAAAKEYYGDYAGAIADRNEAMRLEPRDSDWPVSLGWTLIYAGRTEEGLAAFAKAISMEPAGARHFDSRGSALLRLGRTDEAAADFDRAIQIEPNRGIHYAWRGWVSLYRGEPAAGVKDIDRAAAADRDYAAEAASGRGFLMLHALRLDDAIREYSSYLSGRPNAASGFSGRGFALLLKGDLQGAKRDLEKALEHNVYDSRTVVWLHLARARLGEDPRTETARHARRFDKAKWPGPALAALSGEISIEAMLAAAKEPSAIRTREQEAEAYFVAGEYYLSVKRTGDARKAFEEVLKRKSPQLSVQAGARAELRNLKN